MHVQELFDPTPFLEVLEETVSAPQIRLDLAVTLNGPLGTISAEWSVIDVLTGEMLWRELSGGHPLDAGVNLVASAARRALERAARQLSPF